ncbi:protein phosphatase 2C, putative [Phytophthora infestans T30-4]|uniref:Protein phosphatase 2C, putative n=1 Tax=Phytophthora infestans (strain T30-4) TaxID=403677 RepID=D0N6K2_PHYIT|nr:protein phosphatase 2C, putative [Phytophthora infestans T30-4]EEY53201.1 protein phosphatase 2C, putative [Phytophthora infestans T30-4]|eukprot:XP_002904819.1 protein phosphatase 2C, putative [Phytophthora infestans T30-4]
MAPADVLVASPVNGMVGLEMCSATPPDNCKSPHTPRLLQRAGIRALEQIAADKTIPATPQEAEAGSETMATSPTAAKRKRQSLSPTTSAGSLDSEGPETSPDELEDSQPSQPLPEESEVKPSTPTIKRFISKNRERKRRKVDVIENALKRFHEDETKAPRCAEFTTICHPKYRYKNRIREAAKMRVQVGVSLAQGARPYMEDRYSVVERLLEDEEDADWSPSLLAVYDGHNGAYASEYARRRFRDMLGESEDLIEISRRAQHSELTEDDVEKVRELLVDAFATVDAEILQRTVILNKRDGSTVLLGLLVGGKLFVANLGDSRAVLAQADDSSDEEEEEDVPSAVRLSVDHKPDLKEETECVQDAGGKVIFSGCWRVAHDQIPLRLAISRSLGDHPLKVNLPASCSAPLVSVVPDVRVLNVEAAGEYLVFASDGLWDRLSDDDAAKIVRAKVAEFHWSEEPTSSEDVTKEALQFAANALVEAALLKRSMDNITAMIISFSELSDDEITNA